jgi:hypothetical protein
MIIQYEEECKMIKSGHLSSPCLTFKNIFDSSTLIIHIYEI